MSTGRNKNERKQQARLSFETNGKEMKKYLYYISAGHLFTDMMQGVLPAILPFLISEHGYSYTVAASLVFGLNLISSVVQPLFGVLADKAAMPWLLGTGVFLACSGMAATGLTDSYPLLFISVMISGVGIAAYHPEGARYANKVSAQKKKATGISIFSFGGNMGFAFGPVAATSLVLAFGLRGLSLLFIPAIIMGVLLLVQMNKCHAALNVTQTKKETKTGERAVDRWGAFGLLCVLLFSRSFVFYGMNTFLPLYWITVFGQPETTANTALSIFLTVGALSTLFGGRLADRFGLHTMIRVGFVILLPAVALFALSSNIVLSTSLLIPIGMGLYLPFSSMVVTGQRYLPNHVGLASGVTLGLVISVGGLAAPVLGKIADLNGFHPVMYVLTFIAVIPAFTAFFLPKAHTEPAAA